MADQRPEAPRPASEANGDRGRVPAPGAGSPDGRGHEVPVRTGDRASATRMAPHVRLAQVGAVFAVLGVVLAALAFAWYPRFLVGDPGLGWAVAALVASVSMLVICGGQVLLWRRTLRGWSTPGLADPATERTDARVSWVLHLVSYAVVLVGLWAGIAASADAGWQHTAAVLLAFTLLDLVMAQVLGAVQYVRRAGPPGTIPAHVRRLIARAQASQRGLD